MTDPNQGSAKIHNCCAASLLQNEKGTREAMLICGISGWHPTLRCARFCSECQAAKDWYKCSRGCRPTRRSIACADTLLLVTGGVISDLRSTLQGRGADIAGVRIDLRIDPASALRAD